ncbi:MAG: ABC transporter substrate-binding protein [Nitriliruptoraceae bacterium]
MRIYCNRRLRLFFATVGLVAFVVGCTTPEQQLPAPPPIPPVPSDAGSGESVAPGARGTLRIGLPADPLSIDPRFVVDDGGELIVGALFEPLVRLDDRLRVMPAAAESFDISSDRMTWRFALRDATFHDGTPVTAEDFARAFQRIADETARPLSPLGHLLEPVAGWSQASRGGALSGVFAESDEVLVIQLRQPDPGFLYALAHPGLAPVPSVADEDPDAFTERPIGNGPFQMLEPRQPGAFVRLVRNPAHHRAPLVDEVLLTIYADDTTRQRQLDDLRNGVLHVGHIAPGHLDEAREHFGSSVDGYTGPGVIDGITSTVYLYAFNVDEPPFDDPTVRRAISMTIDRNYLADAVMQGSRVAATSIVPPPVPGSQPGVCAYCTHDPVRAIELFNSTGVDLTSMTLTYSRGATHAAIAEQVAADIERALGINVNLRGMDLAPFAQSIAAGNVSVFRLGWRPTRPTPDAYLRPLFHSSNIGGDNLSRYDRADVDEILDQAQAVPELGTWLRRLQEAEQLIVDDMAVMPLLYYRHSVVITPQVEGVRWPPVGAADLTEARLGGAQ